MSIEMRQLSRRFGDFQALDKVSLSIAEGEFIALLGPSGSGKTTMLRILAGLEFPDSGTVTRNGEDLLAVRAHERGVGLVFQHYALFRHMTVAENVAFGLRVLPRASRPSRAEISAQVVQLLERVQLSEQAKRYPGQLSGGQRQRVALARALAVHPELLLLDEPFGALDAQVRVKLRRWLRGLHEDLKLTSVFVTHDQEEALELADRVAVMNHGRIEQVDTPAQIYQQPATPFVCEFIGRNNKLYVRVSDGRIHIADASGIVIASAVGQADGAAVAYIRPEHLLLTTGPSPTGLAATIRRVQEAGNTARIELELIGAPLLSFEAEITSEDLRESDLRAGARVIVQARRITLFPLDGDGAAQVGLRSVVEQDLLG
jgi:sulfate/thiosulfate transport system ATP-binding protein